MTIDRTLKMLLLLAVGGAALVTPSLAYADENCCFDNFRYAGGCMVVARGGETCQSILSYLNSFQSVGKYYCDNTTVRGGWSLADCGESAQLTPKDAVTDQGFVQPSQPVQQRQQIVRPIQPETTSGARDASLLQVSAPLAVRFDSGVDSSSQSVGQLVTGTLEEDLMAGDTVIAPAGSEVQFRLVPTSYWTDGGGDAFEIQATAVKVGDELVPLNAIAVSGTDEIDTSGAKISVPEGSLVNFETRPTDLDAADTNALEAWAAAWMEAFRAKDIEAMNALYAEDAVLLPPDAPAIFGRDAIRAAIREMFAAGLAIELEDLEIKVAGDLGYKAGRYRTTGSDGSLVDRGKYIEIWKKANGAWVIHRDIWNSSVQPDVAEEKLE